MIIGIELEKFLDKKGADPNCPKWIFPHGDYWAFYNYDSGLRLTEESLSCTGQKSKGGNLNPLCKECSIRDKVFPEVNYHNYLEVLYSEPHR